MALLLIPLFIFVMLVRARWLVWQVERYSLMISWFCWRTKQPAQVQADMAQIWPAGYILFDLIHWDWRHFVQDQDHFDQMAAFIAEELKRTDVDWDSFKQQPPQDPTNN